MTPKSEMGPRLTDDWSNVEGIEENLFRKKPLDRTRGATGTVKPEYSY